MSPLVIVLLGSALHFTLVLSTEIAPQEPSAAEKTEDSRVIGKKRTANQNQSERAPRFELLEDRRMLAFTHPGVLSTQADLDRMEAKVAAEAQPWRASWDILSGNTDDFLDDGPLAQSTIHAGAGGSENYIRLAQDAAKAYQLALRYHASNNTVYADKAVEILNAWAATHTGWSGDTNVSLRAGLYGYQMASAAELMRDYSGWSSQDFTAFKNYMLDKYYPRNADFLARRHDTVDTHYWANWTLANTASMLAIGVLTDQQDIFDEGISYATSGPGTEALDHAITYVHPNGLGQWQESGRDQGHSLMGPQLLGVICEIAWNQGIDLYSYDNNRFLASVEYVSKYNLGYDVPWQPYARVYGHPDSSVVDVHWSISSAGRGQERPGWDLVYNHYVNRMGLAAPYTREYADKVGPEGGGFNFGGGSGGFDGLGFTTLTHALDPIAEAAVPSALRTTQQEWQVTLSWAGSAYAESYNVKRATTSGGPYATIAAVGPKNLFYVDPGLDAGTTYYYVVSANNPDGESADSAEATVVAAGEGGDAIQVEDGTIGGGSSVDMNNAGYQGTGYINFNASGGYVELTNVDGGAGGLTPLQIRFALGNQGRKAQLIVNGASQEITVPSTGTWTNWQTLIETVTLNPGANNTIRIQSHGEDFGNVDEITIKNSMASPSETAPAAPGNLSATPVSNSQIDLSWDPVPGADSYNIKRAASIGGPYVILNNQAGTSYSDADLLANTGYHFAVSAMNSAGESADSAVVSAATSATVTLPAEDANRGGGTIFESTHSGFNGSGYVNFSTSGGYVEFRNVNGGSGGPTSLDLRYALGAADRAGRLIVNDVPQTITLASTGSWTNWAVRKVNITLDSGTDNTIRLESFGQDFGNVDEITVTVLVDPPDLPGDFNLNGRVDGADFLAWQRQKGQAVPKFSGADADGNGTVDGNDLGAWRTNFGSESALGASPAPAAVEFTQSGPLRSEAVHDQSSAAEPTDEAAEKVLLTAIANDRSAQGESEQSHFAPGLRADVETASSIWRRGSELAQDHIDGALVEFGADSKHTIWRLYDDDNASTSSHFVKTDTSPDRGRRASQLFSAHVLAQLVEDEVDNLVLSLQHLENDGSTDRAPGDFQGDVETRR